MFLTSISKLFYKSYLSCTFQMRFVPLALGTACIAPAFLMGTSASLNGIIAALAASITAWVMNCVMLCPAAISFYFSFHQLCLIWDCLIWLCLVSISITANLPYVRLYSHWRKITPLAASNYVIYSMCLACLWIYMNIYSHDYVYECPMCRWANHTYVSLHAIG